MNWAKEIWSFGIVLGVLAVGCFLYKLATVEPIGELVLWALPSILLFGCGFAMTKNPEKIAQSMKETYLKE
jgi:hypothetical protein